MNYKSLGTALITGGAKRLGKAIALNLAQNGYDIVIHCNNSWQDGETLQKIVLQMGRKCQIIQANLLQKSEVQQMVKKMQEIKNWNLLINNASIFHQSRFLTSEAEDLENNFTIHLKVPAILSQALAKNCKINQISGNIINMIDKNITRFETKYFNYILSKKSLAELTKMMALELAPQIRVNGIAPGFLSSVDDNPDFANEKLLTSIPLKKKASEANILLGLNYLLDNDFLTGEILFIDGGASLNHAG